MMQHTDPNGRHASVPSPIIRLGQVKLQEISPHLKNLGGLLKGTLLLTPKTMGEIDRNGPRTREQTISDLPDFEYDGIKGMRVSEGPETFEKKVATTLTDIFYEALKNGQKVRTPWFPPTRELFQTQELLKHLDPASASLTGSFLTCAENGENLAYYVDYPDGKKSKEGNKDLFKANCLLVALEYNLEPR